MNTTSKRIVILGLGNVGFSVLKQLCESEDNLELIAISKSFPDHLKDYLNKTGENGKIKFIQADLTEWDELQNVFAGENIGDIHVLISTVGIPSKSKDFDEYKKVFHTNYFGNVIPIKALVDKIPANSNGRIIILSSTSGNKAPGSVDAYAPSKFALENFSSALQQELKGAGIAVDIIRPTNISNRYSRVFKNSGGVSAEIVGSQIVKLCQLTLKGSQRPGKKFFVPYYFLGVRILERVFPSILNFLFGLKPNFIRKRIYKSYDINKVLITEGSSGIGFELARIYAKQGKDIIITGGNETSLVEAKKELNRISKGKIETKQLDGSVVPDIKGFIEEIGEIDLLINNADQHLERSVKETTIDEYIAAFNTNFLYQVDLTNYMISNTSIKKVVSILSSSALNGSKNLSAYSSSKAALWAYTRSMRRQDGKSIQFLEVISSTFKPGKKLLKSKKFARRIVKAEHAGHDIVFIPFKARLALLR